MNRLPDPAVAAGVAQTGSYLEKVRVLAGLSPATDPRGGGGGGGNPAGNGGNYPSGGDRPGRPPARPKTFRCTNRPFGGDDGPGDDYDEDKDESDVEDDDDDDDDEDDDDEDGEEEEPSVPAPRAKRATRGPPAAVAVDPDPYATTLKTREADKVVAPKFPPLLS